MTTRPVVSVVVPSYNHAPFIVEAICSALEGSDREALEVVVVDDGSTDDTLDRLEEFRGDERVRVFSQSNRGAHAALNRGLELTRGEVVSVLNSDDLYAPRRLEALVRALADPENVMAVSWLEIVDEAGEGVGVKHAWRDLPPWPRPKPGPGLNDLEDSTLALLESNFIATTSNVAFRRSLFVEKGLRFGPLRYAHDWDFFLAAAQHGRIHVIERPLVRYRVHGANTIAEGRGADLRRGAMRFEILWVVARHCHRILEQAAADGRFGTEDLDARARRSLPRFSRPDLMSQLLALRGCGKSPPAAFESLLDPRHPFRRYAIEVLARVAS